MGRDEAWRSPSGVTEDRNAHVGAHPSQLVVWRSPSGVTEDRNRVSTGRTTTRPRWRSPSGVTEDRNAQTNGGQLPATAVAVALRGDRGSQPGSASTSWFRGEWWRSPSGVTEDRNCDRSLDDGTTAPGGGRPPG